MMIIGDYKLHAFQQCETNKRHKDTEVPQCISRTIVCEIYEVGHSWCCVKSLSTVCNLGTSGEV